MKKLFSALLAVAMIASSFVTVMAERDIDNGMYASVQSATEISLDQYDWVLGNEEPTDSSLKAYELVIDLNQIPYDLGYSKTASNAANYRLATYSLDFYTDIDKIENVAYITEDLVTGYADETEDENDEDPKYGVVSNPSANLNVEKRSINLLAAPQALAGTFPTSASEAKLDVYDEETGYGTLTDAFVVYVLVSAPITITKIQSDMSLCHCDITERPYEQMVIDSGLNIAIGEATQDPDPEPETVNYTPVADVDGLSAEFLAKYTGKYMFKSDIIGMTGATTESTVKITRGDVSKNTITLGAALGLTGGADVTAEKIVVAVITSEASGEAFTFEIE